MKTPWWQHVLIASAIVSAVLAGFCLWVVRTHDHPAVVLSHHTDDRRVCDCSEEFRDMGKDVQEAIELSKAANSYTQNFGIYANSLLVRIDRVDSVYGARLDALEKRVTELEKKPKQRRGCGEW